MRAMSLGATNPMNRSLALTLVFEVIVFGLAFPGMVIVSDVSPLTAGLAAGGAALLALAAAGLMRRGTNGWALGWLTQVAGLALGLLTPMMYVVGAIFAIIWVLSFVLGRRIDQSPADRSLG